MTAITRQCPSSCSCKPAKKVSTGGPTRRATNHQPSRDTHQLETPGRKGMLTSIRLLRPVTRNTIFSTARPLATVAMPRAPRRMRSGPYNASSSQRNHPEMPELRVGELNTIHMRNINSEDRAIMLRELQDSFKRTTLVGLPFFEALLSGVEVETGVGYQGCVDTRIADLINKYPVLEKRERLQYIFRQYERGESITEPELMEPIDYQEQRPQHNVVQQHVHRPGIPRLNDIVPGFDTHSFSKTLLDQITQSRLNTLTEYINELQSTAKHHPRLQNTAAFDDLVVLLMEINDQSNTLISIDIEAHEHNQNVVTEIGISIYDPTKEATSIFPNFKNIHLLPEEHIRLRNGAFVADNKDKFLGGNSIIIPQKNAVQLIQCLVDYYFVHRTSMGMSGVLVGHNVGGDVQWLEKLGVDFPEGMKIVDTQTLFGLTHGQNNSSLGGILRRYDIPHAYLHNAGNDAYYTLMLAMKLGDPQFRRWQGVDSFQEDESYQDKLEQRKMQQDDPFRGSRASKPRNSRAKKNNEAIAPIRFGSFSSALAEVFKPAGGAR